MTHFNPKNELSPENGRLLEIAHHIHTPGSVNGLCAHLLDMKQAQEGYPTEQRQLACDFATSANSAALSEVAEEHVYDHSDEAGRLPRALLAAIAKQQQELKNPPQNQGKVIPLFSPPYFEYLKLVHTVASDSDYSIPDCGDMELSIGSSMEEIFADKLIELVIPEYIKEHPEDDLTAFRFSFWNIMRRLTGEEVYAPLSFLKVDSKDACLLYPNHLNEESTLEDFFICAEAISEVSEFLPFITVQNLIEVLLSALRTRLDKELLSLVDAGEVVLSPWALTQAEVLREARVAEEFAENPDIIGNYAFHSCTDLTLVSLPSGITDIGTAAFYECASLALTSLPSGVTSIGTDAFGFCTALALESLPSGMTSVENYAFRGCTSLSLESLPSGITSIGDGAFSGCTNLALTVLPNGLTNIGSQAFYHCANIVLTSLPSDVISIGSSAFLGCTNLALTSLPNGLTSIENYAFQDCTIITNMLLPSSLTSIGIRAFRNCISLANINYNGTTTQWAAVTKGTEWALEIAATYVTCTDGTVAI